MPNGDQGEIKKEMWEGRDINVEQEKQLYKAVH
jgi:hypothetical protein